MIKKPPGQMRQKLVNIVIQVRDAEYCFWPQGKENIQVPVHAYTSREGERGGGEGVHMGKNKLWLHLKHA